MARTLSHADEYHRIMSYREGARYCKMDMHTHSPASECSSFRVPAALSGAFPPGPKSKAKRQLRYDFLVAVAAGADPFGEPYDAKQVTSVPRLARRPALDKTVLRRIAEAWLADISTFYPSDPEDVTPEHTKRRDKLVDRAIRDLDGYLMSLFFPEEYVMRCYIEGLQLVALTDHNHPGEIVLRQPNLGTWFSRLQAVNAVYTKEVLRGDPTGKVRGTIIARLELARKRLGAGTADEIRVTGEIKTNHKDKRKKLGRNDQRKQHVAERLAYWKDMHHPLLPLTLLPGVEITASNVHLLAVFPPAWYVSGRIGGILRAIGIPEEHWGRGFYAAASSSVQDTITRVDAEGGIVIPAHANSDHKGLLRLFRSGLALTKAIEHPALLALETTGGTVKAGGSNKRGLDACDTLRWLDIGAGRPNRSKTLCFIKSSDAHEARIDLDGVGEDLGSRFTYVKLDIRHNDTADEVLRSLRLALMSGQSRVIEFPFEDGYNYTARNKKQREFYAIKKRDRENLLDCQRQRPTILGITAAGEGSYTHGLEIRLNPFLNCVIGSGGKSTFVRTIGYAFGKQRFLASSSPSWLPEQVRVYWRLKDEVYCIQRTGRHFDPDQVEAKYFRLAANGRWLPIAESKMPDPRVSVWPSPEVQDGQADLSKLEDDVIAQLVENLEFRADEIPGPLLVNQPKDIFNCCDLFQKVLAKPHFKYRQIIWSTGSPNVPTALDAEKIIVTADQVRPKKMKLVCAGDLHEDEIRDQMFAHFEGGATAFDRRVSLYSI